MKPILLNVNYLNEEVFLAIMRAFEAQYGQDVFADKKGKGLHCFFAMTNDDGDMFKEHYDNNEAWERTKFYPFGGYTVNDEIDDAIEDMLKQGLIEAVMIDGVEHFGLAPAVAQWMATEKQKKKNKKKMKKKRNK